MDKKQKTLWGVLAVLVVIFVGTLAYGFTSGNLMQGKLSKDKSYHKTASDVLTHRPTSNIKPPLACLVGQERFQGKCVNVVKRNCGIANTENFKLRCNKDGQIVGIKFLNGGIASSCKSPRCARCDTGQSCVAGVCIDTNCDALGSNEVCLWGQKQTVKNGLIYANFSRLWWGDNDLTTAAHAQFESVIINSSTGYTLEYEPGSDCQ